MYTAAYYFVSSVLLALKVGGENCASRPNYTLVSPDFVALSSSGANGTGLSATDLNTMACLVNKKRFEHSFPTMAQHADLIQYAQTIAEYLAKTKAAIVNNSVIATGAEPVPMYNATNWAAVQRSILQGTYDVVSAQWKFEANVTTLGNMLRYDHQYFGSGYTSGYMVQVFGKPVLQSPVPSDLFPACPANETFAAWVYPGGTPDEPLFNSTLVGETYPWINDTKFNRDDGRWDASLEPKTMPDIPYVTSLDVANNVAPANTSTPYAAIAESGPQGMSVDDLNLMVCLINARRYESCLPPVALHPSLNTAAQRHSYMMARNNEISHFDRSGTIGQRFTRYGLKYSVAAENVAAGFHTLYSAYVGWLESQGHLNNILIPEAVYMGAGMNGIFWTNNFASLMDTSMNPKHVPMCPGNETAKLIAFPGGVPETTRSATSACSATLATTVKTVSYILAMQQTSTASVPSSTGSSTEQQMYSPTQTSHLASDYVSSQPRSVYSSTGQSAFSDIQTPTSPDDSASGLAGSTYSSSEDVVPSTTLVQSLSLNTANAYF